MMIKDRPDFDLLMRKLCIGLDTLPAPDRFQAYWDGLSKMSLVQFAKVVEDCLSPSSTHAKVPTIPVLWQILRKVSGPQGPHGPAPVQTRGLQLINGLMLEYIRRRRHIEGFKGDLRIADRRAACLESVKWINEAIAEGSVPSDAELQEMFERDMARIPDIEPA